MNRLLLVVMVSVCLPLSVQAQAKPNFTGTWTLDPSRGSSPKPPAAGAVPTVFVITQNAKLLTLKTGDQTLLINLDGSESVNTVMGQAMTLRARWEGAKLVVEMKTEFQGIPIATTQTSSLNAKRTELTIETVAQTPQGPQRTTQVFKKS